MPSNISFLDTNFPSFTDEDSTEKKVNTIQNYLYMTVESLRYALSHLNAGNMEQDFVDSIVSDDGTIAEIKQTVAKHTAEIDIITQTQTEQGKNIADITETVSEQGASITAAVERIAGDEDTIASIQETVSDQGGAITAIVENVGSDGTVTAASIALAINKTSGTSIVQIDADHIIMTGTTTFLTKTAADELYDESGAGEEAAEAAVDTLETAMKNGSTVINGGCIETDTIALNTIACWGTQLAVKKVNSDQSLTTVGYLGEGYGNDGTSDTYGVMLKDSTGSNYVICTGSGVRLQVGDQSLYVGANGVYTKTSTGSAIPVGTAVWGS